MTQFTEIVKISLIAIWANKVRSILTVLGIIIGISAVIALLSVGQGAQSAILTQVESLGSNAIIIVPVNDFSNFQSQSDLESIFSNSIDKRVVRILNNDVKFNEIEAIGLETSQSFDVAYRSKVSFETVVGINEDYLVVRNLEVEKGRAISNEDDIKFSKVALLGYGSKVELFGDNDAVGEVIKIKGINFTVIGTLVEKGNARFDNAIYTPFNTAANILIGEDDPSTIVVKVKSEALVDPVAIKIEEELLDFYRVQNEDDAPFSVITSKDILSLTSSITGIFTALLASIASISLVVGGIGIMNIMLVSVTERTKEIGLRKALGAKRSAILTQFLTEAVILTLIGGIIGIIFGIFLGTIIGNLANIDVLLTAEAIILATSVSGIIGLVFGIYPAFQASKLNPIDALRYE